MGDIREYIEYILPKFLSTPEGRALFQACNDTADDLVADFEFAKKESLISETQPDTYNLHLQNSSLLKSPYETPDQVKAYLLKRFDTWVNAGTREAIQNDLARFGYKKTKVVDWADLILNGVSSPFGGGFVTIPGANINGGVRYIPLYPYFGPDTAPASIEHRGGINQTLAVHPINIELTQWFVQLATDSMGNVLSTALDVYNLIRSDPVASASLGVGYTGTGLGKAGIQTTTNLPFGYHSFFYVDIDTPNGFGPPAIWDDATDSTYDYSITHPVAWSIITSPTTNPLYAVWGTAANNIWAVGDGGTILHYDGTSWSTFTSPTTTDLRAIWGTAANDIWATSFSGTIIHYDGTSWSTFTSPTVLPLLSIWGSAANNVWAVGSGGLILHYDGTSWSTFTTVGAPVLSSVWGTSSINVWAVGAQGKIYHYDGTSWSLITSPTTNFLYAIWGTAANNVWVVGSLGTILHYDGTSWSTFTSPTTNPLYAVWGTAANDIWAVGESGTILHYDGTSWSLVTGPTTNFLRAIWGTATNDIWAVGDVGTILHYAPYITTTKLFAGATGVLWDGGSYWDIQPPYPDAITDIRKIIRKWKPARMSCRFVRIRVGNAWYTIPIEENYEEDAEGNVIGDFYAFNY